MENKLGQKKEAPIYQEKHTECEIEADSREERETLTGGEHSGDHYK